MPRRPLLEVHRGAGPAGDVAEQLRAVINDPARVPPYATRPIGVEPGDFIGVAHDQTGQLSLAAPIAYDVYYLFRPEAITPTERAESEAFVETRLHRIMDRLNGVRPLRSVREIADLQSIAVNFGATDQGWHIESYFANTAPYCVKTMRFECTPESATFLYPSDGQPDDAVLYLAFPIAQLGVMEILSIYSETMNPATHTPLTSGFQQNMMPPVPESIGDCPGTHLYELAYVQQDPPDISLEYQADDFAGLYPAAPHIWLRAWIGSDSQWPTPGEFVSLLARPMPFHVWWYQETSPILYSGNWFETSFYTSGIVMSKIDIGGRFWYGVEIRGLNLTLGASDFYEYEIGDRVAVLKRFLENRPGTVSGGAYSFDWRGLTETPEAFVILPLSFYEL